MIRSSNEYSLEFLPEITVLRLILSIGPKSEKVLARCASSSNRASNGVTGIEHSSFKSGIDVSSENLIELAYPEDVFKDRIACICKGFVEGLFSGGFFLCISIRLKLDFEFI